MNTRAFVFMVAFGPTVLASALQAADDWPEFRGPGGQGLATVERAPVSWSATKNVTWKRPVPGKGWSSPALHDGKLYLSTAVPNGAGGAGGGDDEDPQTLHVLAFAADDGKELWNVKLFDQPRSEIHSKNSHASPTVVVDGDRLYAHFGTHGTACLELDGTVVWRNRELRYAPRHGNGGSPALGRTAIFISCDGDDKQFVVALRKDDGKVLWRTPRPKQSGNPFSFSTPLIIEVDGKRQVISPGSGYVCSYEPRSGRELWRFKYPGGYSVIPRPLFRHGLVFVCSGYNTPVLYAIRPTGSGDVTATHGAWKTASSVPHTPAPLILGDELYMVSDKGIASCLDARTGKRHWRERLNGSFSAAPVFAGGRIYFQSEDGEGIVIEPGKKYRELGRNPIGERTLASYAVAEGAFFVRSREHLWRLDASD